MAQALSDYQIAGVAANTAFLIAVVRHPAFAAGDIDTGFIERYAKDLVPDRGPIGDWVLALAALTILHERVEAAAQRALMSGDPHSPWHRVDSWRLNDQGHDVLRFVDGQAEIAVRAQHLPDGFYRLDLPGGAVKARGEFDGQGNLRANLGGVRVAAAAVRQGHELTLMLYGAAHRLRLHDPLVVEDADLAGGSRVTAPMPGKIIQVMVEPGAIVAKGKPLLILEAMKMEHTLAAPMDGTIEKVAYRVGDQVTEGAVLISFAEAAVEAE
jgi:3-methylcrotonyl-CoA carboxylase alpha subunit